MTDMTQEVRDAIPVGKLGDKEIQFVRAGKIAYLRLSGGGKLPTALEGGWTDLKNATTAVESFFAKKKTKAK